MLRKLLQGLVFGTGFAVAFVIVCTIWITWAIPKYLAQKFDGGDHTITSHQEMTKPPALKQKLKFLGSPAIYDGDFANDKSAALAAGDGKIIGKITANKQPVKGLHIRLALNGSAMSQWAITDSKGLYSIKVPFGEYRVDGYEMDTDTANELLQNKIDNPRNPHSGASFKVEPEKDGEGLSLDFVDPVIKLGPHGEVALSEDVVVTWEPYPGAKSYTVQVYENENLYGLVGRNPIFKWAEMPRVAEPVINLTALGVPLKAGRYYTVEIKAEDADGCTISETARQYMEKDFKAI